MGADGNGEIAALVVQGCIWSVGGEDHGHSPDHRADGASHRPGNDKDRAASAFVCLARLCRHPLLAEETLLPEIVLEQLRELHAGIAQNIVVNVAWHGGADLIGEIQKQQGDKAEFDLHTVGLVLYLLKIYL